MPSVDTLPVGTRKVHRVALWGSSQVGKTTTFAAYLGFYIPTWIDREDPESKTTVRTFIDIWNKLKGNQLVGGTHQASEFLLRDRSGAEFRFRDMVGGDAESLRQAPIDAEALAGADAVMLFVEWPGANTHNRLQAAFNALQEISQECPAALVITKCEGYLRQEDFSHFALDPFSSPENSLPNSLKNLLETFQKHCVRGKVFPSTVYGWNGDRPAHFYDELGRQVPWNIRPAHVDRPFEFILHQLLGGIGRG